MGEIFIYKCKCGYTKEVGVGFGLYINELKPGEEYSWIPALCVGCSEIVTIKSNEKKPKCGICGSRKVIPYEDFRLSRKATKKVKSKHKLRQREDFDEAEEKENYNKSDKKEYKVNIKTEEGIDLVRQNRKSKIIKDMQNRCRQMGENFVDELMKPENHDIRDFLLYGAVGEPEPEQEDLGSELFYEWEYDDEAVETTYYKCPKCNQFLMESYLTNGHWD